MKQCGLAVIALGSICPLLAQNPALPAPSAAPEIFLVGSVHHMHFEERYHYSLIDLQTQVRSLHPDVVCGEITPEAFNGPMEGNFPPEAAMLAQMAPGWGARFIPADWRVSFSWQDRASQQEARDKVKAAEVDAAQNKAKAYFAAFSGDSLYDYTSGSTPYLAMVDHMFEEVIGENTPSDIAAGAWHERNRKIVENCLTEAGPGMRIVFVFGSGHLPQLRRQLAARGLTAQIPPRAFTPAGPGTMPPAVIARWQRNLKNLEGIADRSIAVSADNLAKAKDTNRAPALRSEIDLYLARQKAP
ncbi:MAG: hypothetical protein ABSG62_03640 [Terracidiphilus sp.]|jgi:hypothetical protein